MAENYNAYNNINYQQVEGAEGQPNPMIAPEYQPQNQVVYVQPVANSYNPNAYPAHAQQQQQYPQNNNVSATTPIVIVPVSNTANGVNARATVRRGGDDPSCLYISAFLGFFIPILGFIVMLMFGCGRGLGPRQARAYQMLAVCTVLGTIINLIWFTTSDAFD